MSTRDDNPHHDIFRYEFVITAKIRGNDSTVLSVQRIFAVMTGYTVIMANIL